MDGGPDHKQAHLPTKIAAAIEFRMKLSSYACMQRRAERDSVANEAERGNSILGRAATIGSSISNYTFKTFADGMEKLEADLRGQSTNPDDVEKIKDIASTLGDEFLREMNMWYRAKELAKRWNGYPCFGNTIFAKTPCISTNSHCHIFLRQTFKYIVRLAKRARKPQNVTTGCAQI